MIYPNFTEFSRLARSANWIPVWTTVPADLLTPVSAYLKLTQGLQKRSRGAHPYSFLLESVEGGETVARYTYLGADPEMVLRFWIESGGRESSPSQGRIEVLVAGQKETMQGDFHSLSQQIFAGFRQAPAEGLPPFTAGAVGYFGYDMISLREPVPLRQEKKTRQKPMPDAVLMFASTVLVFDHVKHQIWIVSNAACEENMTRAERQRQYRYAVRKVERIKRDLEGPLPSSIVKTPVADGKAKPLPFRSNISKARFEKQVRRAKQYITAGDIFQVVLSQRLETRLRAQPFEVYRALRRVNPAPYLFFLQLGDDVVLGSSPEMLVKVTGKEVEYRPIAGTRRRGADAADDARLERELLADEKERAEHVMLVDLGRNDVGRVSEYGSVRVPNLMFVERYSHVMHLVSSVRGRLRKELNAWDALWACFPAGTVTGAPKVRAMQIISELEPTRRGVYAGSVLYFDLTGNLNSCIAIRSVVIRNGRAYVQVGAGIVADSVPEREFEETMNKGKAMLTAIAMAQAAGSAGKRTQRARRVRAATGRER